MDSTIGVIAFVVALLVSFSAIWIGGPTRPVGVVILLGWVATLLVSRHTHLHLLQEGVLIVDLVALIALVALYVSRPSWWLLIIAGAQVNVVLSHALIGLGTGMVGFAYGSAVWLLGIAQLIPLVVATVMHPAPARPKPVQS